MKRFLDKYELTEQVSGKSVIEALGGAAVAPGSYGGGVFSLCNREFSASIDLGSWSWLIDPGAIVFAYTGFGDFFTWNSESQVVDFINVQYGTKTTPGISFDVFLSDFLVADSIRSSVLRVDRFLEVQGVVGDLNYGSCFILQPWLMLGGSDKLENYVVGQFAVYIELVAQTHSQGQRNIG